MEQRWPADLDLSEHDRAVLDALSLPSPPYVATLPIDEYRIRHWCEAFEETDPIHRDARAAHDRGYAGLVAPSASLTTTFLADFRWPPSSGATAPPRHVHFTIKELLGYPVAIVVAVETELGAAAVVGDRVAFRQRLVSIAPCKQTRLGSGHFWTSEREYSNQQGVMLRREQMTAFGYGERQPREPLLPVRVPSEEVIGSIRSTERTSRRWHELQEGDPLPDLCVPLTAVRAAYVVSATRDFAPQHTDSAYAREHAGVDGVFLGARFQQGMVERYLTEWGGRDGRLSSVRLQMEKPILVAGELRLRGRVVRRIEDGTIEVEVTLSRDGQSASRALARLRRAAD